MIPELANVPDEFIHSPWEMPLRLRAVKRYLGKNYPAPIVEHAAARALAAYRVLSRREKPY
ncbi:MAG: FAD-binding domain-containing protein [Vulcanimicrobiaceae bacterium]